MTAWNPYAAPDFVTELDDTEKIVGGLSALAAVWFAARRGWRGWRQRRRDRKARVFREFAEQIKADLAEHRTELNDRLDRLTDKVEQVATDTDETKQAVEQIRAAQMQHLTDHARGGLAPALKLATTEEP